MRCLWDGALGATGHSWTRLNGCMRQAVCVAIEAGFEFHIDDVRTMMSEFRGGYWFSCEQWYANAVEVSNASAWKSLESFLGRTPFIWEDKRLCVGSHFAWLGKRVKVTSFNDDNGTIVACSYEAGDFDNGRWKKKVKKRYKISHEQLLKVRADIKKRNELADRLSKIAEVNGNSVDIMAKLKIKTKAEFNSLPIAKIEKVLAEFEVQHG